MRASGILLAYGPMHACMVHGVVVSETDDGFVKVPVAYWGLVFFLPRRMGGTNDAHWSTWHRELSSKRPAI
jgi:hypothetical protein